MRALGLREFASGSSNFSNGRKSFTPRRIFGIANLHCNHTQDAVFDFDVGSLKAITLIRIARRTHSRVFKAPMSDGGMTRPDRTGFTLGPVADGDDKIEMRRFRPDELIPTLAPQCSSPIALARQKLERQRVRGTRWVASRAVGLKPTRTVSVQQRFGQQTAGRVPCAQEKYAIKGFRAVFFAHISCHDSAAMGTTPPAQFRPAVGFPRPLRLREEKETFFD